MVTILLGVTGSIAAYKACELTRLFTRNGHAVHVLMTVAGTQFVTPLTFRTLSRNPVHVDAFAALETWLPEHITLAERADVFVIAPCTANMIAKLVHGLADDLLSATALATHAPLIIAPAMNTGMWEHPATQSNLAVLAERGATLVDSGTGELACGTTGKGRMADPVTIYEAVTAKVRECILTS